MTTPPQPGLKVDTVIVALGQEIRAAREDRGLSRAELVERLHASIQSQTLATYEQGTRQCTVLRFVEICQAIGVSAPDVLTSALNKARVDLRTLTLRVDVSALASTDDEGTISQLRQWAQNLLRWYPASPVAELTPAEIAQMAIVCDVAHEDMTTLLLNFAVKAFEY
jgi:transcriptional regulator with XRE-family HTH domain